MPLAIIPLLLLVVPILEIAAFIVIGGQIGVFPTLGMILVTAIIGTFLLRQQGLSLITEIQEKMNRGDMPGRALAHGFMLAIAGVLLLTPGFVTDAFGFLLFVPPIRDALWAAIKSRATVSVGGFATGGASRRPDNTNDSRGPTIDLDAEDFGPANPDSPWADDNQQK